jgi:hypothetical protein
MSQRRYLFVQKNKGDTHVRVTPCDKIHQLRGEQASHRRTPAVIFRRQETAEAELAMPLGIVTVGDKMDRSSNCNYMLDTAAVGSHFRSSGEKTEPMLQ